MQVVAVYSEAGGVTKTTTAVSLATITALRGRKTTLIDLDPRGVSSGEWMRVEPKAKGLHVGAILADEDPEGWAEKMAVESSWTPMLRVIPSSGAVAHREGDSGEYAEHRLKTSLIGLDSDVVVLDCPNRGGGVIMRAALTAADTVLYAAAPTADGVHGFHMARGTVAAFKRNKERMGVPANLREAGVVCLAGERDPISSRPELVAIDELRESGLLLEPIIPRRGIVQAARTSGEWYGTYKKKAEQVVRAYETIQEQVIRNGR